MIVITIDAAQDRSCINNNNQQRPNSLVLSNCPASSQLSCQPGPVILQELCVTHIYPHPALLLCINLALYTGCPKNLSTPHFICYNFLPAIAPLEQLYVILNIEVSHVFFKNRTSQRTNRKVLKKWKSDMIYFISGQGAQK